MIYQLFTVFDSKAQYYMSPFVSKNEAAAVRSFSDIANDPQSAINRHPTDYTLFHIGTYDDSTGSVTASEAFTPYGVASEFILPVNPGQHDMFSGEPDA